MAEADGVVMTEHSGLHPVVRNVATSALDELVADLARMEPLEQVEVACHDGVGFVLKTIPYRGHKTIKAFAERIETTEISRAFSVAVRQFEPKLCGFRTTPGSCVPMAGPEHLLAYWAGKTLALVEKLDRPAAVSSFLDHVDGILRTGKVTVERRTFLSGLEIPVEFFEVRLMEGLSLQRITDEHWANTRHFSRSKYTDPVTEAQTTMVLVASDMVNCKFSIESTGNMQGGVPPEFAQSHVDHVLRALHILKEGKVAQLFTQTLLLPDAFPLMGEIARTTLPNLNARRSLCLDEDATRMLPTLF